MQANPPSHQSYRGVQRNPRPGTAAYMQGKKQTALSIRRFHILCAAIQRKYVIRDITPVEPIAEPDSTTESEFDLETPRIRGTIDFSAYKEFKLDPIKDVEMPKPGDDQWHQCFYYELAVSESDWTMREGGVLYALAEYGDFFGCLSHYDPPSVMTGIKEWNVLFPKLQNLGYPKNMIPCMFFGQNNGCLDQNCPFLHDREAVLANREQVLEKRRETFKYKRRPTPRQQWTRYFSILNRMSDGDEVLRARIEESQMIDKNITEDRAYCANLQCMTPWKKGEDNIPLRACKGCKYTMYCSPQCQRDDWTRHKKDPCMPIENIVENDNFWNPIGTRKGTTFVKTYHDMRTSTFHSDA